MRGVFSGAPQVVFDTRKACETIDIPDAPARAFRDDHGLVHLFATHFIARAMVGPTLDAVKHDCRVVYRSPGDIDPAHFHYHDWLYAFYTEDGRNIAALVHSEYDAVEIPGQCASSPENGNCWWNTITFALSRDGGYHFLAPKPPLNLVASLPYRYRPGNTAGAYGYEAPTNIVKRGEFYYTLINDWPYRAQAYGPCLLRTRTVFDPKSWRAWDGRAFAIEFLNPYVAAAAGDARPEAHVCAPVMAGAAESLVFEPKRGRYIVSVFTPDARFGPPGLYVIGSADLIHWSEPTLVASEADLRGVEEPGAAPGNWTYGYVSLLDPNSPDRNFSTLAGTPYVYYVRFDGRHPPYARTLLRRRIELK